MKRILLRDIVFNEGSVFYGNSVQLDSHNARTLLKGDIGDWLMCNGIEPQTESFHDVLTMSVRFRVYAVVDDSLASYYYLRWGKPQQEHVYT